MPNAEQERVDHQRLADVYEAQQIFKTVYSVMKEAEAHRRDMVELADAEGFSKSSIARQLGVSVTRVYHMLDPQYRARQKSRRNGGGSRTSSSASNGRTTKSEKGPDSDPKAQQQRVDRLSVFGKKAYTIGTHPDQNEMADVKNLLEAIDGFLRNRRRTK